MLTQKSMTELFDVNIPVISKHLNNIYKEKELQKNSTISKIEIVQKEGNREVKRNIEFYNLDAITAVGYQVNFKKQRNLEYGLLMFLKIYIING